MTTSTTECPTSPSRAHDRYSDGTCAYCHQGAPRRAPETTVAFRQGEALAYRRVLGFLTALPAAEATRGRDEGRGVAHAVREITEAVRALATDAEVDL